SAAAAAATISSVTTAVFLLTILIAVNHTLAITLAPACVAAALACAGYGWLLRRRSYSAELPDVPSRRPIRLRGDGSCRPHRPERLCVAHRGRRRRLRGRCVACVVAGRSAVGGWRLDVEKKRLAVGG